MFRTIKGKYIIVHERNVYFSHISSMLLYHYDRQEYSDCVFILGDYIQYPVSYFRSLYPDKRIIGYQLEQLVSGPNWHNSERSILNIQTFDEIWDFDNLNVVFLSWRGITVHKLIPTRYTPPLKYNLQTVEPDIDILFYGFMNARRFNQFHAIQQKYYGSLRLVHAYGIFGEQLDQLMNRSKVIFNPHAFEPFNRQEQTRIFHALINGKCVLSEKTQSNWFKDAIIEYDQDSLFSKIDYALSHYSQLGLHGQEIFYAQTFAEDSYRTNVEEYRIKQ